MKQMFSKQAQQQQEEYERKVKELEATTAQKAAEADRMRGELASANRFIESREAELLRLQKRCTESERVADEAAKRALATEEEMREMLAEMEKRKALALQLARSLAP